MEKKQNKSKSLISLLIVTILILGILIPLTQASSTIDRVSGFDKGPSYTSVVPIKKTTFVQFDDENLYDDYAYLHLRYGYVDIGICIVDAIIIQCIEIFCARHMNIVLKGFFEIINDVAPNFI